jgi:hypothetical protein
MQFQTATAGAQNERVFRVARNSFTKTITITAGTFVRGNPVILATGSASANGYDIVHPGTANDAVNELYIGNVHNFPDTTVNQTGAWQPEDTGLVQCYGLDTDALVHLGTVSIAAGLLLTPQSGSRMLTIGGIVIPTGTGSADTGTSRTGVAGLAVLAATVASSSGTGTSAASVFLRAM